MIAINIKQLTSLIFLRFIMIKVKQGLRLLKGFLQQNYIK